MFGTLRIGSEKDSVEFIEHAKGEAASRLGGYVFSHSACESCRLKKVKPSRAGIATLQWTQVWLRSLQKPGDEMLLPNRSPEQQLATEVKITFPSQLL
ncbi:hypothetical protein N7489_007813 [Penicillium chrysogenum]|uniref:CENP-V/GFA domain-containing protein n=1 Tax=Penicillium chrysogenum TaxID=5076 RepID=A0ABQ8WDY0_PENCH|nr:uncharacterized protein N7489_007813 [Penicillium chrysogenum]KAJ5237722.1 hypothetical protein N7489_007813 [Penicillium chrysogenum]KAJ5262017.1 hypothetical protein N7505_008884 [Penicillium chrysogenum]KAJ5278020.1 hypothetical protein N7524_004173 [Penicillium chrysogenum]KAJ6159946.1 hypothetical protein N7497_004483 [Penicillium chrysogenum]